MAFVNEYENYRSIDCERNAILTRGSDEIKYFRVPGAETFTLNWNEKKIDLGALTKTEILEPDGSKAIKTYYVEKCVYPEHLRTQKNEIIDLIKDALHTYGVHFGTREGTEIIVKIDPRLGNLNFHPLNEILIKRTL